MRKLLLSIIFIIFVISKFSYANTYDILHINEAKAIGDYSVDTTIDQMDTVTFGSYPQSDVTGSIKEPIEWIVLEKTNNKALLLSKYILDACETEVNSNFEKSGFKKYLENDFFHNAFSPNDSNTITSHDVTTLSKDQVMKYLIYDSDRFTTGPDGRRNHAGYWLKRSFGIKETNFARMKLTLLEGRNYNDIAIVGWYLSETGAPMTGFVHGYLVVNSVDDRLYIPLRSIYNKYVGCRPAIWVNISNITAGGGVIGNVPTWEDLNIKNNYGVPVYYNGELYTGWAILHVDGTIGYFNNGRQAHGWWLIDGDWYFFGGPDNHMVINSWMGLSEGDTNRVYYVGSDGKMLKNTITPDGKKVGVDGKLITEQSDSNFDQYNNSEGSVIAGLPSRESELRSDDHFYLDNSMQRSTWVYYVTYYYHVDGNGNIEKSKWITSASVNSNGDTVTAKRYVGVDGRMYRGRQTPDGKWVGDDGLVVDIHQDLYNSTLVEAAEPDSWYKTKSGLWYYFENDRTTTKKGWFTDARDNQTYYLDPTTGIMAVGWTTIGGSKYYFNESHKNEKNWYATGGGFYDSYGKKVKAYGSMFKNEQTPDGHTVDANGRLIN